MIFEGGEIDWFPMPEDASCYWIDMPIQIEDMLSKLFPNDYEHILLVRSSNVSKYLLEVNKKDY